MFAHTKMTLVAFNSKDGHKCKRQFSSGTPSLSLLKCNVNDRQNSQDLCSSNLGQSVVPVAICLDLANGTLRDELGTYLYLCGGFLSGCQDFLVTCFALFHGIKQFLFA